MSELQDLISIYTTQSELSNLLESDRFGLVMIESFRDTTSTDTTIVQKAIDYAIDNGLNVIAMKGGTTYTVSGLTNTDSVTFIGMNSSFSGQTIEVVDLGIVGSTIRFGEDYGLNGDGSTDDSSLLETAIEICADNNTLLVLNKDYYLANNITVEKDNINILFLNCTFNVADDGTKGTLTNASTGYIGILFKNCDNMNISGKAKFIGQGTIAVTSLAGMFFDNCEKGLVQASLYFENMAAGVFVSWCNDMTFGSLLGKNINGTQTFGVGTQGSLLVLNGTTRSSFRNIYSENNYKPIVYFSVGQNASAQDITNEEISIESVVGTAYSGSLESSIVSIRSGESINIGIVHGDNFALGLNVQGYNTDDNYIIDNLKVGTLSGNFPDTAAGATTALQVVLEAGSSKEIGTIYVDTMSVTSTTSEGSIIQQTGNLYIGTAKISGGNRAMQLSNSINSTRFKIEEAIMTGQTIESVLITGDVDFNADILRILTGCSGSTTGAVEIVDGSNLSHVTIGLLEYNKNGIGNDPLYILYSGDIPFSQAIIGNVIGSGSTDVLRFGDDPYTAINYQYYGSIPTTKTYSQGDRLYDPTPSAGGKIGSVCVTGGTPGTWKDYGAIDA